MECNDKMLVQMTKGELSQLITEIVASIKIGEKSAVDLKTLNPTQLIERDGWYYGLKGIKLLFGCGANKAIDIKNSGVIDEAIVQISPRKFKVNGEKATSLWKRHNDFLRQGII